MAKTRVSMKGGPLNKLRMPDELGASASRIFRGVRKVKTVAVRFHAGSFSGASMRPALSSIPQKNRVSEFAR